METPIGRSKTSQNIQPIVIPAGSTVTVDSILFASYFKANYQVKIYNTSNSHYSGFNLDSMRKSSELDFSVFGLLGDNTNRQINYSVIGADVIFAVTNGELFPLTFEAVKFT